MSRRRRRRQRMQSEVELNITSMLDMAFQLLAFFVLTFHPSPVEGHLLLHMPPAIPVADVQPLTDVGEDPIEMADPSQKALEIGILSNEEGSITSLRLAAGVVFNGSATEANLSLLYQRLKDVLANPKSQYDRVLIRAAPDLHYGELMRVIDVCTRQTTRDGQPLRTINFVPLVSGGTGQ